MKNSNSPTHEAIAQRAQEIWALRGNPDGHDTAIWYEAERQLTAVPFESQPHAASVARNQITGKNRAEQRAAPPASTHQPEIAQPAPDPDEIAAKTALQKQSARAPRLPKVKNAPPPTVPVSGKPIWDKSHSS